MPRSGSALLLCRDRLAFEFIMMQESSRYFLTCQGQGNLNELLNQGVNLPITGFFSPFKSMMMKSRPNTKQEKDSWFSLIHMFVPGSRRFIVDNQGHSVLYSVWEMVYLFGLSCLCDVLVLVFGTWSYVVQARLKLSI